MDKRVEKPKLRQRSRYAAMTRDLHWDTTFQSIDKIFPLDKYEGIRIHDWNKWSDPMRMTMDAYWKIQGEKDKKLYAVIEAFAQNSGQLGVSDARYVNAVKLILQAFAPLKYELHRALLIAARHVRGDALRIAASMQAVDNLRHFQAETHAASVYNKYFNGMHEVPAWYDRAWYLQPIKSFADDVATAGPFEMLVATGFAFDGLVSDTLFVPYMSGAAHNGDLSIVSASFSAQSDALRHKLAAIATVKFLVQQDAGNVEIVQGWIDKWFWRSFRLMPFVAMMQDYMLPKRMMSWQDSWTSFVQEPVEALFEDLAPLGIRLPAGWAQACDAKDHLSHQSWNAFYGYGEALGFHTWIPAANELEWLDRQYPKVFDRWYRPRLAHYAGREAAGRRYYNNALPMQCQCCQQPMMFTEFGNPRMIAYRTMEHGGDVFHFCSDHCQTIFAREPAKYVQSPLASHHTLHLHGAITDPLQSTLADAGMNLGRDNGGFKGSQDDTNFAEWGGGQDMKEAQL